MISKEDIKKIDEFKYMISKGTIPCMKVPGIFYADDTLLEKALEDNALLQLANVACLPGIERYSIAMPDIHWGYGFPIGGVAATNPEKGGVISPGGVGFDVNCLSPDTNILSSDGYWINIGKLLEEEIEDKEVKIYNLKDGHNDASPIFFAAQRERDEIAIKLFTQGKRELEGSKDHPVLTKGGYKAMEELKEGDFIVIYPFDGIRYEIRYNTILRETDFEDIDPQALSFLKKKGLIPFSYNHPKIGNIVKILGFAFGDSSLSYNANRLTLVFYGKKREMINISKEFSRLGVKVPPVYLRRRKIKIKSPWNEGYVTNTSEYSMKIASRAIAYFFHKLGLPVGKKTRIPYRVPKWIKEAPLWIKRLFLASLFGADGSRPVFKRYIPLPISLTQAKYSFLENELLSFLQDIKELLAEFDINTNLYRVKSLKDRVTYRLFISKEESIMNFLGNIGYEISDEKKEIGLWAYEYLKRKAAVKQLRKDVKDRALKYYKSGDLPNEIFHILNNKYINERFIKRAIYEHRKGVRIGEVFFTFDEFLKDFALPGGFVLDEIKKIEIVRPTYNSFFDIGISHNAHNFVANGILVHNCGIRVLRTNLTRDDIDDKKLKELVYNLFSEIPSGLGKKGKLRLSKSELKKVIKEGAKWAVKNGYGDEEDLEYIEEEGRMEDADPDTISKRALERGAPQLGTLGSGNHFLEIQYVSKIFSEPMARVLGLFPGQITVMIHTGSRGFGHEVCSDYLDVMQSASYKYKIELPDRQLASVPFESPEGRAYFSAMAGASNFAWANREIITHWVREVFYRVLRIGPKDLGMSLVYDVAHNIAKKEVHRIDGRETLLIVHRKGATRAFGPGHPAIPKAYREIGQPVLIPGDMGRSSYILSGTEKAMNETFGSACHGAGRLLSRNKAKKMAKGRDITEELRKRGIMVKSLSKATLSEEMSDAYKDVNEVVNIVDLSGIAKKVAKLKPIGVMKG